MDGKISMLIELQTFPPIYVMSLMAGRETVHVEYCENYQKGGFRNRYQIAGPNEVQSLTVPLLKGKHQKQPVTDVEISYIQPWHKQHLQAIKTAYGKSPFFIYYYETLAGLFLSQPKYLLDFNIKALEWVIRTLGLSVILTPTTSYMRPADGWTDDYRNIIRPDSTSLNNHREYSQVFEDRFGFRPGLSVLDLIFCAGPAAKSIIGS